MKGEVNMNTSPMRSYCAIAFGGNGGGIPFTENNYKNLVRVSITYNNNNKMRAKGLSLKLLRQS